MFGYRSPYTFSPFDVVGHLIDGEETDWMARARIVLARGPDPRFEPYDRFRHRSRSAGRTLDALLDEFARLRAANLAERAEAGAGLRAWSRELGVGGARVTQPINVCYNRYNRH